MKRLLTLLAATSVVLLTGERATAGWMVYQDQASFLAALAPGSFTNTFPLNDQSFGQNSTLSYSKNQYAYSAGAGVFGVTAQSNVLSPSFRDDELIFKFPGNNVTAVGGNFWVTSDTPRFGRVPVGGPLIVLVDGQSFSLSTSGGASTFFGFVGNVPISTLILSPPQVPPPFFHPPGPPPGPSPPGTETDRVEVSNFTVGAVATPEPASVVMTAFGLFGVLAGAVVRRRNGRTAATAAGSL